MNEDIFNQKILNDDKEVQEAMIARLERALEEVKKGNVSILYCCLGRKIEDRNCVEFSGLSVIDYDCLTELILFTREYLNRASTPPETQVPPGTRTN